MTRVLATAVIVLACAMAWPAAGSAGDPAWTTIESSQLPGEAVVAFEGAGTAAHVCRAKTDAAYRPGSFTGGACHIHGTEGPTSYTPLAAEVQVLLQGADTRWVASGSVKVPETRVPGGGAGDAPTYVCRSGRGAKAQVGELTPAGCIIWVPAAEGGALEPASRFEVLVDAAAFEQRQVAKVLPVFSEVTSRLEAKYKGAKTPKSIADAQAQVTDIEQTLKTAKGRLRRALQSIHASAHTTASQRMEAMVGRHVATLRKRQETLKAYIEIEQKKETVTTYAQGVVAQIAAARAVAEGEPAQKMLVTLQGLRKEVATFLAKPYEDAGMTAHVKKALSALPKQLDDVAAHVETQLPEADRLARIKAICEAVPQVETVAQIDHIQKTAGHLERLIKPTDSVETQLAAVGHWSEVIGNVASALDSSFPEWGEEGEPEGLGGKMYNLPAKPGLAIPARSRALAAALERNGMSWKWPDEQEAEGEGGDGGGEDVTPYTVPVPGWKLARIQRFTSAPVRARVGCLDGLQVSLTTDHLLACDVSIRAHPDVPDVAALATEVPKRFANMQHGWTSGNCRKLARGIAKTPFKGPLDAKCKEIAAKEALEKKVGRLTKTIGQRVKSKKFKLAWKTHAVLTKLVPKHDEVDYLRRVIESAQQQDAARKDRAKAMGRALKLKRKIPTFEAICKSQLKINLDAYRKMQKAYARGRPKAGDRYRDKRQRSYVKGCEARAKVLEVYWLYKNDGNSDAADAALSGAPTCNRRWRACD